MFTNLVILKPHIFDQFDESIQVQIEILRIFSKFSITLIIYRCVYKSCTRCSIITGLNHTPRGVSLNFSWTLLCLTRIVLLQLALELDREIERGSFTVRPFTLRKVIATSFRGGDWRWLRRPQERVLIVVAFKPLLFGCSQRISH